MSDWAAKRFWDKTETVEMDGGFGIALDGRPVKTPAKVALKVPTQTLADRISEEWQAQEKLIDPNTMPYTRTSNAAIDKVAIQHSEVADMLADYGDSDLLCYRAEHPEELVTRQAEQWDPVLDWAADEMGVRLASRQGVMHAPQEPGALKTMRAAVHDLTSFELAAFHDLVSISGSLLLGFATARQHLTPDAAWGLSRLDEAWQEEQWGVDEEAQELAEIKRAAFLHAADYFFACR